MENITTTNSEYKPFDQEEIFVFTVETGGKKVKSARMTKNRMIIGSILSADIRIVQNSVSNIHAVIEKQDDGKLMVFDLASESGTLLNDRKIVTSELKTGDTMQIGFAKIVVEKERLHAIPDEPARIEQSAGQKKSDGRPKRRRGDLKPLIIEDESRVEKIFDYKRCRNTSLQLVMFYNDSILEVSHFIKEKKVTIGAERASDFPAPEDFEEKNYPIVVGKDGQYLLNVEPRMKGVIRRDNNIKDLGSVGGNPGVEGGGTRSLALKESDLVKVSLGDVNYFVSFTPAPPRIRHSGMVERDPLLMKVFLASMAFTIAVLLALSSVSVPDTIEIEQLPERIATMIYEPPKLKKPKPKKIIKRAAPRPKKKIVKAPVPPAPPKPKKTKPKVRPKVKKMASGRAGEGAKHKGAAGTKGKATAKRRGAPSYRVVTPGNTKARGPRARSGVGKSKADGKGFVDVFTKSVAGKISKLMAGSRGMRGAGKKLEGYGGFTTRGSGGFALSGTGKGGGGTAKTYGLGKKGIGGGKIGKGLGALGLGGKIVGGRGRLIIDTNGYEETIVLGSIDKDEVDRLIKQRRDQIRYCYEKELGAQPKLAGKISIRFVIGATGFVKRGGVSEASLRNPRVGPCIMQVIKSIRFPSPRGGGIAEVNYPFLFKPSHM